MHLRRHVPNRSMTLLMVLLETHPNIARFSLSALLGVNRIQHDGARTHTSEISLGYLKTCVPELWNQKVGLQIVWISIRRITESVMTWKHSVSASDSHPEELKARIVQCWEVFTKATIIKVIDLLGICLH